jgi:serine/threonine-protein kinase
VAVGGYEVLSVLGRGAMGVVYKARQKGLNRMVALKMILAGDHAGENEMARFRTEAEAVAQIQHPNIVQIYEVGEEAGLPFFSLEYVEGGSLDRKLAGNPQPPREAARLVGLLAAAVDCAHRKGVVHRDLKPANVLMTPDGQPKITDFGLAKKLEGQDSQTHTGAILGTPSYMAPEQAEGKTHAIGPLSDVYSLGAILYEMLTGRVPFKAPTLLETLEQVRSREPVPPTELQDKLPRDLETVCLKCLQKDPKKRYAGAAALAEDLRRFLANEPIQARPVSRAERLWRWCRRNPRVAFLAATVLLVLMGWAGTMSVLAYNLHVQKMETENARDDARTSEAAAKANEKIAKDKERIALANEKLARRQHDNAVIRLTNVGEEVLKKLQAPHLVLNAGPEVLSLREDLLNVLRKGMMAMAGDIEKAEATSFATLGAHQHVGDSLRRLGLGEQALRHYRKGHDIARKTADEQPDSDQARGNLSVLLLRLGDMELELHGDARAAREHFRRATDLRQEIADHPRSGDFDERDNQIGLSHLELRLGKAELELGDPSAARTHFRKSVELRRAWSEAKPELPEGVSYLAEACLWLGIASWHQEDATAAEESLGQAVRLCEGLFRKNPGAFWYQADLAEVQGFLGDARLRLGKPAEAEKAYGESLKNLRAALARVPEETAYRLDLALTEERLADLDVQRGRRGEAERHDREALRLRGELLRIEPNNLSWQAAHARSLTRCGKDVEAAAKAEALCRKNPKSTTLQLDAARCYAACAARAGSPEAAKRYAARAVEAVRRATASGYADTTALRTDPDLAALAPDPAYRALLEGLAKR